MLKTECMNKNLRSLILSASVRDTLNKIHFGFNISTNYLPYCYLHLNMITVVYPVKHKDKRIHNTTLSQRHSLHDDVISRAGHLSGEVTLGSISKSVPGHGSCSCTQNTIINTIKWSPAAFRKICYMAGHAVSRVI